MQYSVVHVGTSYSSRRRVCPNTTAHHGPVNVPEEAKMVPLNGKPQKAYADLREYLQVLEQH